MAEAWFDFRQEWLRPFFFYGNNPISLIGGAITTASALSLIGFWVIALFGHGGSSNPYLGIILDLCLPGLFVLGLILIPVGILVRRSHFEPRTRCRPCFPRSTFGTRCFATALILWLVATLINFVIVGTASYRGVAYMDTPSFCGASLSCHGAGVYCVSRILPF